MEQLDLSNDDLLATTRAVRKRLDFDRPLEREALDECMALALQAPTGSNAQGWHFLFVTDPDKRAQIAELYRQAFSGYAESPMSAAAVHAGDPTMEQTQERVMSSAQYLADNLHRAPVFLIPCIAGRFDGFSGEGANVAQASSFGSVIPAAWSFMLAARARGLGTCWTTLHLMHERTIAELLGIPYEEITQVALIPVAYTKGTDFKRAPRKPVEGVVHFEAW
ncbi:MAG: nitroreductase [Pseudomonadales bacterium]|nr:nitroreductase family protein [Pseudomonadales bacterium]NIX07415.1 nitroreductase [Pseudomonadales bacterium]